MSDTSPAGPHVAAEHLPPPEAREIGTRRPMISAAELIVLAAASVVGLVALVSLAAAHLHDHTPAMVASGSIAPVGLARVLVHRYERPSVRLDLAGPAPVRAGLGLVALMMYAGFRYGTGDQFPVRTSSTQAPWRRQPWSSICTRQRVRAAALPCR